MAHDYYEVHERELDGKPWLYIGTPAGVSGVPRALNLKAGDILVVQRAKREKPTKVNRERELIPVLMTSGGGSMNGNGLNDLSDLIDLNDLNDLID